LKKDRDNALFGKATAAGGTDGRYDAQTNINQFKGDKQLSVLGMGNNTNKQGFSMADVLNFTGEMARGMRNGGGITVRMGGGDDNGLPVSGLGQNQQGVAKTFAGGANYNNTWNNRKTDLNANFTTSDVDLLTNRETSQQNLLPGNNFTRNTISNSVRRTKQQRLQAAWDQKIDSFTSFKMTPSITWQDTKSDSYSKYLTERSNGTKMGDGFTNSSVHSNAVNFQNNLLLRHRFGKKGRTISANLNMAYNHSESKGDLNARNSDYTVTPVYDSLLNQKNTRDAVTRGFGASATYTEPIGKRSLIELSAFYNDNQGESDRTTYNYNNASGKYDALNSLLTNNFESNYTYEGGSLNFRSNLTKLNLNVGASLQSAILKGENHSFKTELSQKFTDVLPNASLQYKLGKTKTLRADYSTNTVQPSITQMQPTPDVSDPLNIYKGNPNLKRQYNQTISMNYFGASMEKRTNMFAFLNYTVSDNAIITADSLKPNGTRISQPINVNGVKTLFASANFGFPLKKLKSTVSIGSNMVLNNNISYLNGQENKIRNLSVGPNVNYNFSIDTKIDLQLTARYNYTKTQYSLQPVLNNDYWQQTYSGDMTNYLPFGLVLNNQLNYVINTGRADGYNTNVPLWNASIAKGFGKNKRAELKLSGFDLLDRNIGVTRSANQNFITDTKYNVLKRYFMMGFTYSLNKSGLGGGPRMSIRSF
jgi:outer membrane receptor protein involved in Fe transport